MTCKMLKKKFNFTSSATILLLFPLFLNLVKCDESYKNLLIYISSHRFTCANCAKLTDNLLKLLRGNVNKDEALLHLEIVCQKMSDHHYDACARMAKNELEAMLFIARNNRNLTGSQFCAIQSQINECTDDTIQDWLITFQPKNNKTTKITIEIEKNNENVHEKSDLESESKSESKEEPLNILHLTDVHFDNLYTPGSNSRCGKPLCCQRDSGEANSWMNSAGYWGDYNVCDIPLHTVRATFDHILKTHKKIDLIYYTGDVISHIGWKTSRKLNTHDFIQFNKLLQYYFGDIPIYSVLGNHDAHPQDLFSADSVKNNKRLSTQWLYDLADKAWSAWLPKSTSSTIKRGGFYSVLVKPKFRVVGLNSNVCYFDNKWLLYDDVDPYGQLQWLADTLQEAEDKGESVHILSHFPPGSRECYKIWNREFVKIVKRYSETVKAQFNGHSHEDEWRVFFDDEDPKKVLNVAFNGGSLTTFTEMNPNYKMFEVNPETMDVMDYHTWIFNVNEANITPNKPPRFYKLYSFVEDYKLGSLTKENLGKVVEKIENDVEMQKLYWRFQIRESDRLLNGCNGWCLKSTACFVRSVYFEETSHCAEMTGCASQATSALQATTTLAIFILLAFSLNFY